MRFSGERLRIYGKNIYNYIAKAEILGHKSPTITLDRYAHSMTEHKREMMNKPGKML